MIEKYGKSIQSELANHGEYRLTNPTNDSIVYVIETAISDDFALRNDSRCIRIQCSLNDAFPEITSDLSVDDFVAMLDEYASSETVQSAGTSYYFAEEYTAVYFSYFDSEDSMLNAGIELDVVPEDGIIHPSSTISLKIIAG